MSSLDGWGGGVFLLVGRDKGRWVGNLFIGGVGGGRDWTGLI